MPVQQMNSGRDPCPGLRGEGGYCALAMLGNRKCMGDHGCDETDGERKLEAKWAEANRHLRARMDTWFGR